jgi:hypothetical protein
MLQARFSVGAQVLRSRGSRKRFRRRAFRSGRGRATRKLCRVVPGFSNAASERRKFRAGIAVSRDIGMPRLCCSILFFWRSVTFREKNLWILGGSFFASGKFASGRSRVPAAKFLADFLHRVEWSSGGGRHFAGGARARRIESNPLVDGRTKFG